MGEHHYEGILGRLKAAIDEIESAGAVHTREIYTNDKAAQDAAFGAGERNILAWFIENPLIRPPVWHDVVNDLYTYEIAVRGYASFDSRTDAQAVFRGLTLSILASLGDPERLRPLDPDGSEIGRASCRERV